MDGYGVTDLAPYGCSWGNAEWDMGLVREYNGVEFDVGHEVGYQAVPGSRPLELVLDPDRFGVVEGWNHRPASVLMAMTLGYQL